MQYLAAHWYSKFSSKKFLDSNVSLGTFVAYCSWQLSFTPVQKHEKRLTHRLVRVHNAGIVCYLPLLVDELLRTFMAQTVHQLSVIPGVTAYKFAQHRGPPLRFGWRDRCPGRVGDPALKNCPGKGVSAAGR